MGELIKTLAAVAAVVTMGTAQATLVDRGGGMIYDDVLNITWLADLNYAQSSGYAAANARGFDRDQIVADGRMGWDAARAWADSLVYGGHSDWRLPTLNWSDPTCGDHIDPGGGFPLQSAFGGCTGGELSHLFVADLGNRVWESVLDQTDDTAEQLANLALFTNVQAALYWSGTEYGPDPGLAWRFRALTGTQYPDFKGTAEFAVAVRDGDVAPIPEPTTLTLVGLALAGLGFLRHQAHRRASIPGRAPWGSSYAKSTDVAAVCYLNELSLDRPLCLDDTFFNVCRKI